MIPSYGEFMIYDLPLSVLDALEFGRPRSPQNLEKVLDFMLKQLLSLMAPHHIFCVVARALDVESHRGGGHQISPRGIPRNIGHRLMEQILNDRRFVVVAAHFV